jgi:DNA-binding transcriptional MerR regulator
MNEPFVPIEDVAKHFSVSISTVRAWVRQEHIPKDTYVKIGNTYRFRVGDVADALTSAKKEKETIHVIDSIKNMHKINDDLDFDDLDEDI